MAKKIIYKTDNKNNPAKLLGNEMADILGKRL